MDRFYSSMCAGRRRGGLHAPRQTAPARGLLALLALLAFGFAAPTALAQVTISGRVVDAATGESIPGANVVLVELGVGSATDLEGRYRIANVRPGTYTLQASFTGYTRFEQSLTVASQNREINIQLQPGGISLDDVVVTGYGVERRREITSSSSIVGGDELRRLPVRTVDSAIQGRAAGVRVTSASGQPGGAVLVRVRGVGSINAGNAPLFVIDGVPVGTADLSSQASSNPLNSLNPADIESVEILKDAAASAIYGAQAANGVVLVTTRAGRTGATRFDVQVQAGTLAPIRKYDLLTGPEFVNLMIEAWENHAVTTRAANVSAEQARINGRNAAIAAFGNPETVGTYDWQNALYRTGQNRKIDVSASGGTSATRFYISGGVDYAEGQVIMSDYNRASVAVNVDHRATRRLELQSRIRLSNTEQFGTIADGNFTNGPFFGGPYMRPTEAIYNEDGSFNTNVTGGYNIVQGVMLEDRIARTRQLAGSFGTNFQLLDNLFWRNFAGIDYRLVRDTNYRPREIPSYAGTGGSGFEAAREVNNWNANTTLSYLQTFNRLHNVDALVGAEYRQQQRETFTASGNQFPSGLFRTLRNAQPVNVTGFFTEYKIAGLFSRVRYDYDQRYTLTASLRRDGSSRFGANARYGTFYSVSGAWDAARESFMDAAPFVETLRFRASYGVTGNSEIADFASRSLIGSGGSYAGATGLRPVQLGNDLLTWEQANVANLGLDLSLFRNRIRGSIDAFSRINNRLLLDRPLPTDVGFDSISENVGRVRNEGLEFELSTVNVRYAGFEWTTDFNIAFLRNEVLELSDGQQNLGDGIRVGHPLQVYYLHRFAGVNPADGRSMWYDANGNITYTPVDADRQVVGKILPDYTGGLTNALAYGGFRIEAFLQFNVGQQTFNQQQGFFLTDPSRGRGLERSVLRRWTTPGQITDVPRAYRTTTEPNTASNLTSSTRFLESVSYVRLKNLTASYALPTALSQRAGFRIAQIFVQSQNLFTITPYSGLDPELTGTQNAVYPQGRTFTTGLQVQF